MAMKRIWLTFVAAVMSMSGVVMAQEDDHLRMHFDFENVSGTDVVDSASGITARVMGAAKVVEVGKYHALDLGNGVGFLNMTASAGAVVKELGDFTVSTCYRVADEASLSGNGYFLWAFSTSAACTASEGKYMAYRLNAQRIATSTGGFGAESGIEVGTSSQKGRWMSVVYRQSGSIGELFVDGKRVGQNTAMPILKNTFTTAPIYCWIGRAPFTGDSYLKQTLMTDFRIYDIAVTDEQVKMLTAVAADIENEFRYGNPGDPTALLSMVEEAKNFLSSATEDYAPNAIAEVQDAINIAEMEIATARASQPLLDERRQNIQNAINHAKSTVGFVPKRVVEPSSDYGFVHPGGIVSQDDIDHAKQLLAAGDARVKRAWDILCANEYAQSTIATWPTETIVRGGGSGQNYMNVARGAAMAFQNALRWKIAGTRDNADAAVRILMAWARGNKWVSGDTNLSLAAGIYGHQLANAAELMRDYDGWSRDDFEEFRQYMVKTWYNPAIDFLRRRHDTWLNARNANVGQRPGHYWSNWGLCNALCVMSIGILCDDVHMYNQGLSFYKYDHVGTFKDRSKQTSIQNDGCNEFIGNLVPVVLPDSRGPLGFLGQMQESGRDQGHALMALGLAIDICQVGLNQGDDLYAYMDDRIAAGIEHVAAFNFGGVAGSNLPWINYNYADCRTAWSAPWVQSGGPNEGGKGEYRPYWDRALGYYEGQRGIKLQYAEKASAKVCPDGGGGNYSQNSGGFDHLGFSTLTHYRPLIDQKQAKVPLSGNIVYHGQTFVNQTNLGGLKYNYEAGKTKAIPADGAEITLRPQLPEGTEDTGLWVWNTGATTRDLTVKADHSHIYRVTYTAQNGVKSTQAFAIAVAGDAPADKMDSEVTVDGVIEQTTEKTVLYGTSIILYAGATTGWTNDYLWDDGQTGSTITIPALTTSREYICQYANQSGAVSQTTFRLNVVPAIPTINGSEGSETQVLAGSTVTLGLLVPSAANPESIIWSDGSKGSSLVVSDVQQDMLITATYQGQTYTYSIDVKATSHSYYSLLTSDRGYQLVNTVSELAQLCQDHYFVLAADEADLLLSLQNAPKNGNKALLLRTPAADGKTKSPTFAQLFQIETYSTGFTMRNMDYDGLTLQTEWDRPDQLRTHDQPYACEWSLLLMNYQDGAWTIENGKYPGNWMGLWTPANGLRDGEELACNKTGSDILRLQIFAIEKNRFLADYIDEQSAISGDLTPVDVTPFLMNPAFTGNGYGWTMTGTWGNQRYNGAVEVWHSTNFDFTQTISGLPDGEYTISCQLVNGEGANTGYLYATSAGVTEKALVRASCKNSNFDAERDKMAANPSYALLTVDIEVRDGSLSLGIAEPSSGNTWLVWDNFTLSYKALPSGIVENHTRERTDCSDKLYDLQGRMINSLLPRKGIYIRNGKKFQVK